MVRAHSRACTLSVTPGNSRRNSTVAANSPRRSNAARIAAASASLTTNIAAAWEADHDRQVPAADSPSTFSPCQPPMPLAADSGPQSSPVRSMSWPDSTWRPTA
jgi:hypothetical protein